MDGMSGDIKVQLAKPTISVAGSSVIFCLASVLAVMTANECHRNFAVNHLTVSFLPSLLYGSVTWFWWVIITIALWKIAQRYAIVLRLLPRVVFIHLVVACLLAISHLFLLQHTIWWASAYWSTWGRMYAWLRVGNPERFGGDVVLYGFIYGLSSLLYSRHQTRQALVQNLEVQHQLTQAQLKALQMQMEPHFLFNTLNAVTSLVAQGRNPEAMKTLAHLNTILRTTLQRRAPEKVPFTEELGIIESYLAIQQVRFADRLQVKIDATPEALEGLVPCFLLQPIIENAIQHGIAPMEMGGLVETCVKRIGDKLWMQVRDNGSGSTDLTTKGYGIGMQNTKERLAFFYPGTHHFVAAPLATGGYEVTIQIPYERAIA